ncbi:MAG: hypothetical protein ACF8NJ_09360 [Phycisphaerales bacterium JB038]
MAKRKKQTKSRARKPKAKRERTPINWPVVLGRTTTIVIALFFVSGGIAWALGVQPLREYVAALDQDTAPVRFELDWPLVTVQQGEGPEAPVHRIPYIGAQRAEKIRRDLHALVKPDPFDQRSLAAVGVYLRDQGWLKEEEAAVRRRPDEIIEVSGVWRLPQYVVRHSGYDYLIGGDFGLLPPREVAGSGVFADGGWRFIEGVYAGAPRNALGEIAPGLIWAGTELRVAAGLLALLEQHADLYSQVAGVKVEPGEGTAIHQLTIITDQGTQIIWGRPPGEERGLEHTAEDKIAVLRYIHEHSRRIDMGEALIDIRTGDYEIDRTAQPEGA